MTRIHKKGYGLIWLVAIVAVIGVAVAGYFVFRTNTDNEPVTSQENSVKEPEKAPEASQETVATGTVIKTSTSEFGDILFDGAGQAIYIWEVEESATAECYGDCAVAWPPVLTDGTPIASNGVSGELLGTTVRTDGTTQVTYNGHPLYYYAHEEPGEVKCHNVSTHGGLWWVVLSTGVRA